MDKDKLNRIVYEALVNKNQFETFKENYKGDPKEDALKLVEKYGISSEELLVFCCLAILSKKITKLRL